MAAETQHEQIRKYIETFGSITSFEAFTDLGITKLATRISEMRRQGMQIADDWITRPNRWGQETQFKRYYLVK